MTLQYVNIYSILQLSIYSVVFYYLNIPLGCLTIYLTIKLLELGLDRIYGYEII
jgi:hypothetical protein